MVCVVASLRLQAGYEKSRPLLFSLYDSSLFPNTLAMHHHLGPPEAFGELPARLILYEHLSTLWPDYVVSGLSPESHTRRPGVEQQ